MIMSAAGSGQDVLFGNAGSDKLRGDGDGDRLIGGRPGSRYGRRRHQSSCATTGDATG